MNYQVLLYYKYTEIADPEAEMRAQRELCESLGLTGRIIVAAEGINGTVEGTIDATEVYVEALKKDERFADIHMKRSPGTGQAFPKLSIKVRLEIVAANLKDNDLNPQQVTGTYLTPEELHQWFEEGREFYIVDMRNDYEHAIGHFEGSILPSLKNFRDLPGVMPELESLKDKTILTVCTGGVRCEKASGFLKEQGFKDVYQLQGGIVSYMEKYPNEHFKGRLYVFDGRVTMAINEDGADYQVVGRCGRCEKHSENYVNCANKRCNKHFICCTNCALPDGTAFCSDACMLLVAQPA